MRLNQGLLSLLILTSLMMLVVVGCFAWSYHYHYAPLPTPGKPHKDAPTGRYGGADKQVRGESEGGRMVSALEGTQ